MHKGDSQALLEAILTDKEKRVRIQEELLKLYGAPVIAFTVNIPGPSKKTPEGAEIHDIGVKAISAALDLSGIQILGQRLEEGAAGRVAFFSAAAPPIALKQQAIAIEEAHPLGRLFDIDILTEVGISVSREALGYKPRGCLICSSIPAVICRRSQSHSLQALNEKIRLMLNCYKAENSML